MSNYLTNPRFNELVELAKGRTLTADETSELRAIVDDPANREAVAAESQERERVQAKRIHLERSRPRLIADALHTLLGTHVGGPEYLKASEDTDFATCQVVEDMVGGLFAFLQEARPDWTIQRAMSTLLWAANGTYTPAAKYNGIDYDELQQVWNSDKQEYEVPEGHDWALGDILSHMQSEFHDPEAYGHDHLIRPIGEHDFSYELQVLPRGSELHEEVGMSDVSFGQFVGSAISDGLQQGDCWVNLEAARAEVAAGEATNDIGSGLGPAMRELRDEVEHWIREGWINDGMLGDTVAEILLERLTGGTK